MVYAQWGHPDWVQARARELVESTGKTYPNSNRKALLDYIQARESDSIEEKARELFNVAYGSGWKYATPATQEVWRKVARHVGDSK